jgi:hypothetical protein
MYVNGKMRPVETLPEMGRKRRRLQRVNSTVTYLIFFPVLGFELRAYPLSHSTSPFL